MDRSFRFAEPYAFIEVPEELQQSANEHALAPAITHWANDAAHLLDTLSSGIVFRIGKMHLPYEASREIAVRIANVVTEALKQQGLPEKACVETDRIRPVKVWKHQTRTLLPHNDGAHCSYLTPSLLADPSWDMRLRTFSHEHFSTTQTHKLYQGIFVNDPGEGISVTTYYDWLAVLQRAYHLASGKNAFSTNEVQHWLGKNIQTALANQAFHKNRYLSIGAALGSSKLSQQGVVIHAAEEELTPQEKELFPDLTTLDDPNTLAHQWVPARTRFLGMVLSDTLGMSWEEFRALYEICVPSERFDYVLAHNLTLLHGGLMGGATRLLEPICVVIDHPEGDAYETWLSKAWQRNGEEA